jgi:hypothetical protein
MSLPYDSKLIPLKRRGAYVLLESVGFDDDALTPEQRAAVRELYFLDDKRTVRELFIQGLIP